MTHETEKLEDAFNKIFEALEEPDQEKRNKIIIRNLNKLHRMHRRYAEVLPLLGEMAKQKTPEELGEDFEGDYIEGYESMVLTARKIAAIVARGE